MEEAAHELILDDRDRAGAIFLNLSAAFYAMIRNN